MQPRGDPLSLKGVKYCLLTLIPAALLAQSTAITTSVDINGNHVQSSLFSTGKEGERTELSQSINGRLVPKEQTESRVLSETPSEKVTETLDRKFDQNGQLVSIERTLTTERKLPGGGTTTAVSIYRSDVNGAIPEVERRTTETQPHGPGNVTSDITIARPANNGRFEVVEQRKIVTTTEAEHTREDQTVYLKSLSGDFLAKRKTVTESQKSDHRKETSVANYESDYTGRMALLNSETQVATVSSDGQQIVQRNIYASASDGVPRDEQGGQKIKEQQMIVRTPGPDGSFTETVSVRRPTLADQSHLGPPTQISETVCTGKCEIGKP